MLIHLKSAPKLAAMQTSLLFEEHKDENNHLKKYF
jgi:hypothetical protein